MPNPAQQREADTVARLMLIVLSFTWAMNWPFNRIALDEMPPFSMRLVSCFLGALFVLVMALVQRRGIRLPNGTAWAHVAIAGVLNVGAFTLLTSLAQLGTTTSRVIILVYSMPIWACLLAWPILGERINRRRLLALVLCATGITVLVLPLVGLGTLPGLSLAAAAAMCWAAGTVYLKWAHIPGDQIAIAVWQLIVGLFFVGAMLPIFEAHPHFWPLQTRTILAMTFVGLIGGGFCYFLWFAIVRRLPTSTASLGVLAGPVIGIAASAVVLGERPTGSDYVGFALILSAAACVLLAPVGEEAEAIEPTL